MNVTSIPAPIRAGLRLALTPFRGPISWMTQHRALPGWAKPLIPYRWATEPFTLYGPGWTCRYFSTPQDPIGHGLFYSGLENWEPETLPIFLDYVKRAECFIDVGANFGIYSLLAAHSNPRVRTVALEPVPYIFEALRHNIDGNNLGSRVELMQVAASNAEGTVPFHQSDEPTMGSLAVDGYKGYSGKVIEVRTVRLDSLQLKPQLIKIDVEGFEDAVLEGAPETIRAHQPAIILEANPDGPYRRITEIMTGHNYQFFHLLPAGPKRMNSIQPDQQEHYRNWLCLPRSAKAG